jgi:hypothetical protein
MTIAFSLFDNCDIKKLRYFKIYMDIFYISKLMNSMNIKLILTFYIMCEFYY